MHRLTAAAITAILAAPAALHAQAFISGAELAKACAPNSRESASCNAYIAGALDQVERSPDLKTKLCLPPGTKLRTLRESVASYAAERPDATKGSAVEMVDAMVMSHFPCK